MQTPTTTEKAEAQTAEVRAQFVKTPTILRRNPVHTLSQRPLCLRDMLRRIREREHRRRQNREFWRRFFGLDRSKVHRCQLGDKENVESNLALRVR